MKLGSTVTLTESITAKRMFSGKEVTLPAGTQGVVIGKDAKGNAEISIRGMSLFTETPLEDGYAIEDIAMRLSKAICKDFGYDEHEDIVANVSQMIEDELSEIFP